MKLLENTKKKICLQEFEHERGRGPVPIPGKGSFTIASLRKRNMEDYKISARHRFS